MIYYERHPGRAIKIDVFWGAIRQAENQANLAARVVNKRLMVLVNSYGRVPRENNHWLKRQVGIAKMMVV
jgi:hypothetical protein